VSDYPEEVFFDIVLMLFLVWWLFCSGCASIPPQQGGSLPNDLPYPDVPTEPCVYDDPPLWALADFCQHWLQEYTYHDEFTARVTDPCGASDDVTIPIAIHGRWDMTEWAKFARWYADATKGGE